MRRIISLLLAVVMMISMTTTSFAANTGEEYYTVQVEYSDNIGHQEELDVMIQNNNVFVDAKMLAERLGYTFGENGESAVILNKDTSNGLPFGITQFKYNSTQVSHMLFNNMVDTYEAPFASVKNREGSWIPLEYSLLLINSGMMITDDALLIDIPTKRIIDYFYDIAKNSEKYNFDWADDFGYTETELKVLGGSSHLINVFNGLLGFDGASWATLFQQFAGSMASYDKKYGENLALLLCTESDKELQASIEKVELLSDLLDVDGDLGKLLSFTSDMADFEVGTLYKQCEAVLDGIKTGNSTAVAYSKSYQALENALDRQTWFSNTGGNILDVQKGVSNATGKAFTFLEIGTKVAEVVGYAQEFQNQDKFSLAALMYYLDSADGGLELPQAMKKSMIDHSDALSGSIAGYMEKRFLENVDQWLVDAAKDEVPLHKVFGSQAAAILIVWDIASNTIPFIANGLSGADSFELALYSLVFQGDTYLNYLGKRDSVFADDGNITAENLYDIAQYCYIYLKSCYITREAALASLANKSSSTKEKIQPLIDYQNSINAEIAKIMVELKGANKTNDGCVFGFLPSDNEAYLGKYDDSQLISWIKEPKKIVEKIELTSDIYHDTTQGMAYEYATITAYSDMGDIVWSYETPKCIMTEMTAVVELGQKGNYYYFVEDTSVVCIDVQSGTILWKNDDYAGRATGFAFGENAIYLCGQYGPDFYAISYDGTSLAQIEQFDPQYYWASKIELLIGTAAVYLYGGTEDYNIPMVYYVDLETFNFSKSYNVKSDEPCADLSSGTVEPTPESSQTSTIFGVWDSTAGEQRMIFSSKGTFAVSYENGIQNADGTAIIIDLQKGARNFGGFTINGSSIILTIDMQQENLNYSLSGDSLSIGGLSFRRVEKALANQLVGTWENNDGKLTFDDEGNVTVTRGSSYDRGVYAILSESEIMFNINGNRASIYDYSVDGKVFIFGNQQYIKDGESSDYNEVTAAANTLIGTWKSDTMNDYYVFRSDGVYEYYSDETLYRIGLAITEGLYDIVSTSTIKVYQDMSGDFYSEFTLTDGVLTSSSYSPSAGGYIQYGKVE